MLTRLVLALFLICLPALLSAEPRNYRLDQNASSVSFTYVLSGQPSKGTMPIEQADLVIDFARLANSRATVTLNAARARTGLVFATDALKSNEVLAVRSHPKIRFVSKSVRPAPGGAEIRGDVTIRGVTRPLTLDAKIYRQRGTQQGDLSKLTILLTGQINRNDFAASGYPKLVGETVELEILARIALAQ